LNLHSPWTIAGTAAAPARPRAPAAGDDVENRLTFSMSRASPTSADATRRLSPDREAERLPSWQRSSRRRVEPKQKLTER